MTLGPRGIVNDSTRSDMEMYLPSILILVLENLRELLLMKQSSMWSS